jgi:hypothetical protein
MTKLDNILETLKEIECPVDKLEEKVIGAYKEISNEANDIRMERVNTLDGEGLAAYSVHSDDAESPSITILVKEGSEHYVASVEDAYVS